jgi:hypothetical protein
LEYFKSKNVVIIGPNCDSPAELAPRIKDADILAVVNKGHRSKNFVELRPFAREVALFHCLDRTEETGGGDFSSLELRRKGFRAVIYPLSEDRFADNIAEFHRRNVTLLPLRRIGRESYADLKSTIKGFTPNTGYAAIWTIARGGCASLYVSGINFLRIPYHSGYHPHLASHQAAIALIEKYGNHNPDLDLESFRALVKRHNIQVDKSLADILCKPTQFLFYQQR